MLGKREGQGDWFRGEGFELHLLNGQGRGCGDDVEVSVRFSHEAVRPAESGMDYQPEEPWYRVEGASASKVTDGLQSRTRTAEEFASLPQEDPLRETQECAVPEFRPARAEQPWFRCAHDLGLAYLHVRVADVGRLHEQAARAGVEPKFVRGYSSQGSASSTWDSAVYTVTEEDFAELTSAPWVHQVEAGVDTLHVPVGRMAQFKARCLAAGVTPILVRAYDRTQCGAWDTAVYAVVPSDLTRLGP